MNLYNKEMVLKLAQNAYINGDADFDLESGCQMLKLRAFGQL
jgi:hypothetical protein